MRREEQGRLLRAGPSAPRQGRPRRNLAHQGGLPGMIVARRRRTNCLAQARVFIAAPAAADFRKACHSSGRAPFSRMSRSSSTGSGNVSWMRGASGPGSSLRVSRFRVTGISREWIAPVMADFPIGQGHRRFLRRYSSRLSLSSISTTVPSKPPKSLAAR